MRIGLVLLLLFCIVTSVLGGVATNCAEPTNCSGLMTDSLSSLSQSGLDGHHAAGSETHHCPIHCSHVPFYFSTSAEFSLKSDLSLSLVTYSFPIPDAYIEAPFRPPLA